MGLLKTVAFKAGVVKDETDLIGRPQWSDSDRIRFVRGLPQKIGGWAKKTDASNVFEGVVRGMLDWTDWGNTPRLAIGTEKRLYILEGSTLSNITPYRDTGSLTDPFTTTNLSADVTVTHVAHGLLAGDYVIFENASAVGGITVDGEYTVTSVTDDNNYVITHGSAASSGASGGGSVDYYYEIHIGRADGEQGSGWGVGPYGEGTYGEARSTSIVLHPRIWMFDLNGDYLIAKLVGGPAYQWTKNSGARATLITNAPTTGNAMFMTSDRHLVSLGPLENRLLVEWASQDAITVWTPSDTNTAGDRGLTGGNELVAGVPNIRGTNLLFTDQSVWTMTFIGGQDVFGFREIGSGDVGLFAPHSFVVFDNVVYWMGGNDFYMFDGTIKVIPNSNDIRRFVFDNITALQSAKVVAGSNSLFKEIWFFYSTATENNRYVKYNVEDRVWDVGTIEGTAWVDKGAFDLPVRAASDGYLYDHETGNDADGGAMSDFVESTPFMIGDGQFVMDVDSFIPDFKDLTGEVVVTLLTKDYAQSNEVSTAIGTVTSTTEKVDPRISGRQAAVKFESVSTGSFWRTGNIRLELGTGNQR